MITLIRHLTNRFDATKATFYDTTEATFYNKGSSRASAPN